MKVITGSAAALAGALALSCSFDAAKLSLSSYRVIWQAPEPLTVSVASGSHEPQNWSEALKLGRLIENVSASDTVYTNVERVRFAWAVRNARDDEPPKARFHRTMEIFKNAECFGAPFKEVDLEESDHALIDLENQTTYSVKVYLETDVGRQISPCSPAVVSDRTSPESPDFLGQPLPEIVQTTTTISFTWKNVLDRGISGVRANDTFLFELFHSRDCAGTPQISKYASTNNQVVDGLIDGEFYSARVGVFDRSGNERKSACSANFQINTDVAGFTITDATARPGTALSRQTTVDLAFTNDSKVGFWCLTPSLSFEPLSVSISSCPNGQGPHSGWHNARPTHLTLSGSDGLKVFRLWVANPQGAIIGSYYENAITLDRVEPPAFTLSGITGGSESLVDDWLRSTLIPTANWTPPATAYDAKVRILRQSDSILICETTPAVTGSSMTATPCDGLLSDLQSYIAEVVTYDLAGNPRTSAPFTFRTDLTPPASTGFTVTGVQGGADNQLDNWNGVALPFVQWTGTADESSPLTYWVSVTLTDGTVICPSTAVPEPGTSFDFGTISCAALSDGETYRINLTAIDLAGNTTTATNSPFVFRADLSDPVISFTATPALESIVRTATFTFSATDSLSGVRVRECRLDAGAWTDCTSETVNYAGLPDGSHTFDIHAVDNVGNDTTESYTWVVGADLPIVSITSAPASRVNTLNASFSFTGNHIFGPVTFECSLDAGAYADCTSPHALTTTEGQHTINVRSISRYGQRSNAASATWIADVTGPVVTLVSKPASKANSTSATFDLSATDGPLTGTVARFECKLDGASFTTCPDPHTVTDLSEGNHTMEVRAVDSVENTGASVSHTWLVDVTPPALSITSTPSSPQDEVFSGSVSFTTSDSSAGLSLVQCRMNGGSYSACTSPYNFSGLTGGTQTFEVRSTDQAGNVSTQAYSWFIYTYSWSAGSWTGCTAAQPSWQIGGWGSCDAGQPAWQYSDWGECSSSCGGGSQSRGESCPTNWGNQYRSVSCPTTAGTESRTVTCMRNDGTSVDDSRCGGGKPATSQACSRNDCSGGAPSTSQSCSRGGGEDCNSRQSTSQSCNTHCCPMSSNATMNGSSGSDVHWSSSVSWSLTSTNATSGQGRYKRSGCADGSRNVDTSTIDWANGPTSASNTDGGSSWRRCCFTEVWWRVSNSCGESSESYAWVRYSCD